MNYYKVQQTTYLNGKRIRSHCGNSLTDIEPQDSVIKITWDNLEEELPKIGPCGCNLWHRKRGRMLQFFPDNSCWDFWVKEWKEPNIIIEIKITYTLTTPSLKTILEHHDGEAAIKYLLERGISIVNAAE